MTYDRGTPVEPGAFEKVWRVRNDSDAPWPAAVHMLHAGGDDFGSAGVLTPVRGGVVPGEEVDLCLNLTAPAAPGHYHGHFRLANDIGHRFGPRFGVNVVVPGEASSSSDGTPVAAAGVAAAAAAGAGGGEAAAAGHGVDTNAAAVEALVAAAPEPHRVVVANMLAAGVLPRTDPLLVKAVLRRLSKVQGDLTDAKVAKVRAWYTKHSAKRAKKASKKAAKAAKKLSTRARKRARKEARKAARKAAKKEAKRAKFAKRAARRQHRRRKSSGSSSSSSSSSDTSSSSSDSE